MKHRSIIWKCLSILLCGVLLFSNLTPETIYAGAENAPEAEVHEHAGHVHDAETVIIEQVCYAYEMDTSEQDTSALEAGDMTRPVISFVIDSKYVSGNYYCNPPAVTVTDEGENLQTVTVKTAGGEETKAVTGGRYSVDLTGVRGSVLITAVDDAGNTELQQIYITHILGARQGYSYEATCTEPEREIEVDVCAICNEAIRHVTRDKAGSEPKAHQFEYTKTIDVSVCGGQGTITQNICIVCGYVEEIYSDDYVEGTAHDWEYCMKEATCEASGAAWQECYICGAVKDMQTIDSIGHRYGSWETGELPDCVNQTPGTRVSRCLNGCGKNITQSVAPTHTWSERVTIQEPTCEEEGYSGFKCVVCGIVRADGQQPIPALGHDYSDDNDCTTASVCSRCGKTTPNGGEHNLGAFQTDGTYHWQACMNEGCNYETAHEPHVRPASAVDCTNAWVCDVCGIQQEASYRVHNFGDYASDGTYHWQTCTNEGCTVTTDKAQHTGTDDGNCETEFRCTTCDAVVREAKTHVMSTAYTYGTSQHWLTCDNEGCTYTSEPEDHVYTDDRDCTTDVKCETCGYVVIAGEASHDYTHSPVYGDEYGHYQMCQNGNCDVINRLDAHSGGTATCVTAAVCDICYMHYGDVDPSNHVGVELRDVKQATDTEDGYTGDEVCTGCGVIVKKGEVINHLDKECVHEWQENKDDVKSWEQCTKCGATQNEKLHSLVMKNSSEGHWQQCETCSYETTVIPHIPNQDENNNDCTTALTCLVCGYEIVAAMAEHSFSESWVFDEETHWHVCTNPGCDQISEKVYHDPDNNGDCTSAIICKDCGHILIVGMDAHNWSTDWQSDADGHYHVCQNIGCKQVSREEHRRVADDGICTTPVVCEICQYEMEAGASAHDFSGEYYTSATGHYQKCQNPGCNVYNAETPHSGNPATCVAAAVCQVCGVTYGEKDPANHTGETEIRGYIEPTTEAEGYTGDTVCTGCGEIVSAGTVIDKLTEDHEHVFDRPMSDDLYHWYECRCGARENYAEHSFSEWQSDNQRHWHVCADCDKVVSGDHIYENGICTVCGSALPVHEHSYEWKYDNYHHWQECTVCGETFGNDVHTLEDGICIVCGAARMLGDVNNDGVVDAEDALLVLKHAARLIELDAAAVLVADVNEDGEVDAEDALNILKYAAHLIDSF